MTLHPTPIPLSILLTEADLPVPKGAEEITVRGITADSREVRPGDLFIAISGLHTDARTYIPQAVAQGAVAVVCETSEGEAPPCGTIPAVTVPNARVAMACLYDAWYGHPARGLCLVGVTGTNGKTSVSTMLYRILRGAGVPCGLIGTVGCYTPNSDSPISGADGQLYSGMTTPDPAELYPLLARIASEVPYGSSMTPVVVMEVTSHALLLGKVAPLTFDLSVFTNLSSEHMDLHGTMEDYFEAKLRLFHITREAVVNADDRWGRRLLAEPTPVHHYHICHAEGLRNLTPDRMCPAGEGTCTRFYAEQVKNLGEDGVSFKLSSPDVRLRLRCPVPGQFTVMNAMQAAVAALSLGVSPAVVRDTLASFGGVPGRMERVRLPETDIPFSVFIDFAHTPDALEKLLASVHGFRRRGQRIVLVFGCGGDRDRSKRKIMARIASRMTDSLVVTSDNSRTEDPDGIISDILSGVDKESEFAVVPDRAEAIRYAIRHARAGDIILLAGKGHENYEIDRTGKHPFCEKDIAVEAAEKFHAAHGGGM
ncbi:MAG: UDP-N-acetylmuramoyl-L-alanyl-D-glutamate--2,6-diaminopimelate ligase [Clostridia bacterium]|nr:UDP-N-acetylmuramoyl-L-alanyl-D-glutamate--2,6-diaminopimelate ligase [Clostridia bacterium]